MKSRLVVIAAALLLIAFVGCGKKADPEEVNEANNLINGLNMLGMMTDVDAYNSLINSGPFDWFEGPTDTFDIPVEWGHDWYYKLIIAKFPVDSSGTAIDSCCLYWIFEPDVWDSAYVGDTIVALDAGFLAETRNIWFHTRVTIEPDINVTGTMRWNWEETFYDYAYDMSIIPGDTSGEITITTSTNISLSAHFLFDARGAGTTEDNWAAFSGVQFVRYEFFAEPDPDDYDGYFILLSENWKVQHYFTFGKQAAF